MSKKKSPLIPLTGKAPQPKAPPQPPAQSAEAIMVDALAKLDTVMEGAISAKKTIQLFYNELAARQNYINSLPKPEEAKA